MSLINDLLRDLDARHAPRPGSALSAGQPLLAAAPVRVTRGPAGALIGGLLVAGVAAGGWFYFTNIAQPVAVPETPGGAPARDVPMAALAVSGEEISIPYAPPTQTPAPAGLSDPTAISITAEPATAGPVAAVESASQPADSGQRGNPLPAVKIEPPAPAATVTTAAAPAPEKKNPEKSPVKAVAKVSAPATTGMVRKPHVPSAAQLDQRTVRSAREAQQTGRVERAESILRARLQETPAAHASREMLITLLLRQDRLDEAGRVVADGLEVAPQHTVYRLHQARVRLSQGDAAGAVEALQAVPQHDTDTAEYLGMLAVSTQKLGDHVAATALYRNLLQRFPPQASWWVGLAVSLEASEMPQEAGTAYREGARLSGEQHGLRRFANERLAALARVGDS